MIGAIVGDIIGSQYEGMKPVTMGFDLFTDYCRVTDDSILTLAVADALKNNIPFADNYRKYYRKYPRAGFGGMFIEWAEQDDAPPNNSYGNGAVMRISPVGYLDTIEEIEEKVIEATVCTHDHPTSRGAAFIVARAIFQARQGLDPIKEFEKNTFLDDPPPHGYGFYNAFQTTIMALQIIKLNDNYEDCIRHAVYLGGDTDTLAAVTGSIAEPMYGISHDLVVQALSYMDDFQLRVFTECAPGSSKEEHPSPKGKLEGSNPSWGSNS